MTDVLLVSMPFGPIFYPSLGLSLLKAHLAGRGISATVKYFSIAFSQMTGRVFYDGIADGRRPSLHALPGEWIFAGALFPTTPSDEERYAEEILRRRLTRARRRLARSNTPAFIGRLLGARHLAGRFLDRCLEDIAVQRPRVVGFTSVFQQHLASLALARRIKAVLPDCFVVFGGANCEGVMGAETVRQFPFVDAAVSGEGDLVIADLVQRLLASEDISGLPGVRTRANVRREMAEGRFCNAPMVRDLDALPHPDYTDYFRQFGASRYRREWQPHLLVETSRGCWWGERMHCTFCGLNGSTMAYRSKSPDRALSEIRSLARRHPGCDLQMVDNILDLKYFDTVLPALASERLRAGLFYETKANLKKDDLRLLRKAGIREIQPGIESFSDPVLKLMRKGVTGLQNVQLLKWCRELAVVPSWNFLWGIPGEPPGEYERMTALVPLLSHLPPPAGFGPLRLDRFSPNFFDSERLGFADVRPLASYRHVYPSLPPEAVANLAYYFDYRPARPCAGPAEVASLVTQLRRWRRASARSALFSVELHDALLIWDLRPIAGAPLTVLKGLDRVLYQASDAVSDRRTLRQIAERCAGGVSSPDLEAWLDRRLTDWAARGLMILDGARCLSLAIPLGDYSPSPSVLAHFFAVAGRLGKRARRRLIVPLDQQYDARARSGHAREPRPSPASVRAQLRPWHFSLTANDELVIRRLGPSRRSV